MTDDGREQPRQLTEEELQRLEKLIDESSGFLGKDRFTDDELDAKLRDIDDELLLQRESREEGIEHFDKEFDTRFKALEEKAQQAKARHDVRKAEVRRENTRDRESAIGMGVGLTIAYTIIGMPLLGAGIGWLIDNSQRTSGWIGICTTIGAVVGLAAAMFMINRNQRND